MGKVGKDGSKRISFFLLLTGGVRVLTVVLEELIDGFKLRVPRAL